MSTVENSADGAATLVADALRSAFGADYPAALLEEALAAPDGTTVHELRRTVRRKLLGLEQAATDGKVNVAAPLPAPAAA